MKKKLFKLLLPAGMGLALLTITVFGLLSSTFTGCTKEDVCKTAQENEAAKCNTTSGGIKVYGVTVPEDCTCPSNTTFAMHDVNYKVNECICK